jgi:acyl-CoA thioester hydrolase
MAWEFVPRRRVDFTDVDMGGVVHFSNYFRYMESAERLEVAPADVLAGLPCTASGRAVPPDGLQGRAQPVA